MLRQDGLRPCLILLDLMMPVMDGWQFRVLQKQDPTLAGIPVVAVSADGSPKAAAIDADAYLRKPINYDQLVGTLSRLLIALERKRFQVRYAELERLTSLGTMAAGMAHEINNPLTSIVIHLDLASREVRQAFPELDQATQVASAVGQPPSPPAKIRDAIGVAQSGADRIRILVRDLMTFGRQSDDAITTADVAHVLDASINLAAHQIRNKARVVKEVGNLPTVRANEHRLGQVFLNLLVNAAQAMTGDPSVNEIRVTGRVEGDRVIVEFADTGSGIPSHVIGRIFEPFFTTKPAGIGMGLGLAICHSIVLSFGGKLTVDSIVGKGSVFRVELAAATHSSERVIASTAAPAAVAKAR
jgi:signal transduction histidine kinase